MSKGEYILESFPSDEEMEKAAHKCTMLAYCPDRPFSFCLKKWVEVDGELMFHKVTWKHCHECLNGLR